jgi:hypothetical protein
MQGLLAARMQIHLWKSDHERSDSLTEELTLMEFADRRDIREGSELEYVID